MISTFEAGSSVGEGLAVRVDCICPVHHRFIFLQYPDPTIMGIQCLWPHPAATLRFGWHTRYNRPLQSAAAGSYVDISVSGQNTASTFLSIFSHWAQNIDVPEFSVWAT